MWRLHHRDVTVSTNIDARGGSHGDVFTADFQTAGRGRLDHKWLSPPGANVIMSAVLSVRGLSPETVSTLPLVVGLAVARGLSPFVSRGQSLDSKGSVPMLKWPNDVLIGGRKVAGILCELDGDKVIAGIGINVKLQKFPDEIEKTAISLEEAMGTVPKDTGTVPKDTGSVPTEKGSVPVVREAVLGEIGRLYEVWAKKGFGAIWPEIAKIDCLRGQTLAVRQTDDDTAPVVGVSGGVQPDGSLDVGGVKVYAGEAHVERAFCN